MGADTHVIKISHLSKDEGILEVFIQSWGPPKIEKVLEKIITGPDAYPLHHGPYCHGRINCIKITDAKHVLVCDKCYMRLELKSSNIVTLDDLRRILINQELLNKEEQ